MEAGHLPHVKYEGFSDKPYFKAAQIYPQGLRPDYIHLNEEFPNAQVFQDCEDKGGKLYRMVEWIATREYHVWLFYGLSYNAIKALIRAARANKLECLVAVMEFMRLTANSLPCNSKPIDEICNIADLSWTALYPEFLSKVYTKMFSEWDVLSPSEEEQAIKKTNCMISQCTFSSHYADHPFMREDKKGTQFIPNEDVIVQDVVEEPTKKKKKWF